MQKYYTQAQAGASEPPPPASKAPPSDTPPTPATQSGAFVNTADTPVRLAFLRKVYTLLTINFLITIGISCLFAFVVPLRDWIVRNPWVVWAAIGLAFASLIALSCIRLKFPVNLILMYVFVVTFSLMIAAIVARYYVAGAGVIVLQAFLATTAVFVAITAYVFITKKDFSFLYGFLGAALFALIGLIIINFAFSWIGARSRLFTFFISLLGALVMTGYLLFDTSMVMTRYGPDDWLPAVISLYIDVTQLFLFLLNIFSFASN